MKKVYLAFLILLIGLCIVLAYDSISRPIKVALIGNFVEERYSFVADSIVAGRIAENDINNGSRIRGKRTQLIIKNDDFSNPEETIKFLLDNHVEAIVTTSTSQEVIKIKPYLDKNSIVCLSVGATASSLSESNDYIYRILPDDEKEIKTLLDYCSENSIKEEFTLVYDETNLEYKNSVEKSIKDQGGKVILQDGWSENSLLYTPSNVQAMKSVPILILGSARDTAFILQKLKSYGITDNVFGLSWSGDKNLMYYGGKAIEGFKIVTPADFSESNEEYRLLTKKLEEYHKDNGLLPYGVYQAFMVIRDAYKDKYEKHLTLKEAIDRRNASESQARNVNFDKYGDSNGEEAMFMVKDKEFTKLGGKQHESAKN